MRSYDVQTGSGSYRSIASGFVVSVYFHSEVIGTAAFAWNMDAIEVSSNHHMQVEACLTFKWHWEKLGMSGTGTGELDLKGGSIDYRFRVVTNEASRPSIAFDDVSSRFTSVDLTIKSFASDWLYQAVMSLFNEQIQKAVQNGIASALQNDVPENLNKVLDTLPTKLDIKGLPFSTSFEYSIFTLTYVLVKGYGQVESDSSASQLAAALRAGSSSACPYSATPLPLSSEDIAADSHMTSIYLHESVINCMLWGLYNSDTMRYTLQDGTIPKLHLTTDLLAMLIPGLPKAYPHQFLKIDAQATGMPKISFSSDKSTTVQVGQPFHLDPLRLYMGTISAMLHPAVAWCFVSHWDNLCSNAQMCMYHTVQLVGHRSSTALCTWSDSKPEQVEFGSKYSKPGQVEFGSKYTDDVSCVSIMHRHCTECQSSSPTRRRATPRLRHCQPASPSQAR